MRRRAPVVEVIAAGVRSVPGKFVEHLMFDVGERIVEIPTSGYAQSVAEIVDEIAIEVASVRADSPQMDVLGSLDLAVRAGRSLSDDPPRIVMIDSALSTVAPIDFTQPGMLSADPGDVVEHLRMTSGLLDLEGAAVLFYGIGTAADPQQPIPPGLRRSVSDIWEAVASASKAGCVETVERAGAAGPSGDLPAVDAVPVSVVDPIALSDGAFSDEPVVLGSDVLRFGPDTAELVDPQEAQRVADVVAGRLVAEPPMCIEIVGTAATGIPGRGPDALALSEERAHAVAGLLIAAGIPASAVRPRGIGAAPFDGRQVDIDAAGMPIPAASALNRTVRIEDCR